ncbi:sialidase family protein [Paenibacillus sp. FSL R5-0914]|uniref:sialidase family protein n=1 Tax=Paenibacillus sp. FSL R5-0914 TaxID=2921665 RepID=UPI0030F68794
MNWTKKIHRTTITALSATLIMVSGWGASASSVHAAASAIPAACGTGDHGLLQSLQNKHSGDVSTPLTFSDVQFLNGNIGRAAGNGFMIGTSDGGCNFQEIYEGQWSFKQIDFPDNVHGFALASVEDGQARYLIGTSNGGSEWKRLSNKAVSFERIDFIDSKIGFGYNRASTYYTKDGGLSWSKISTPSNTRGAYFSDRNTGWAVVTVPGTGYRVMKTADGGKTWSLSLKVAFTDPEYGQITSKGDQVDVVLYGGSGMSQTSYSLYTSTNKGKSWNRVIAQETAGGGPAPGSGRAVVNKGPASGRPGNLELIGNNTAFLVGYSDAAEKVAVGRTYNGGKQWTNLPAIAGYEGVISFTSNKEGWLAVRERDYSSLYVTKDGGASWQLRFSLKILSL